MSDPQCCTGRCNQGRDCPNAAPSESSWRLIDAIVIAIAVGAAALGMAVVVW